MRESRKADLRPIDLLADRQAQRREVGKRLGERLASVLQKVDSVWNMEWAHGITYAEIEKDAEYQNCVYNFDEADVPMLFQLFDVFEKESARIVEKDLVFPAFDLALKCSHVFNLLDARGSISVSERASRCFRLPVGCVDSSFR